MLRQLLIAALSLCCVLGCDGDAETDAGTAADAAADDAAVTDSGVSDAGSTDAGATDAGPSDSGPSDAGAEDAGGGDAGPIDGGAADAGTSDAGPSGCRCFSATQVSAIAAHGGTAACFTGMSSGTVIDGEYSSTIDAQMVQLTVQEISGFAGVDWFCGAGCVDTNDDTFDDCGDAPLGPYGTELIDEAEHDRCEALIAAACE